MGHKPSYEANASRCEIQSATIAESGIRDYITKTLDFDYIVGHSS